MAKRKPVAPTYPGKLGEPIKGEPLQHTEDGKLVFPIDEFRQHLEKLDLLREHYGIAVKPDGYHWMLVTYRLAIDLHPGFQIVRPRPPKKMGRPVKNTDEWLICAARIVDFLRASGLASTDLDACKMMLKGMAKVQGEPSRSVGAEAFTLRNNLPRARALAGDSTHRIQAALKAYERHKSRKVKMN